MPVETAMLVAGQRMNSGPIEKPSPGRFTGGTQLDKSMIVHYPTNESELKLQCSPVNFDDVEAERAQQLFRSRDRQGQTINRNVDGGAMIRSRPLLPH